jgi:hypothetical protein
MGFSVLFPCVCEWISAKYTQNPKSENIVKLSKGCWNMNLLTGSVLWTYFEDDGAEERTKKEYEVEFILSEVDLDDDSQTDFTTELKIVCRRP